MDKDKILDEIFNNDPLGLLNVKPKSSTVITADERLLASFQEINDFVKTFGKEPKANSKNVSEFQLYFRLKNLREDTSKIELLKKYDTYDLLPTLENNQIKEPKTEYGKSNEINSFEDIFNSDYLGLLDEDSQKLFDFKHTPKDYERAKSDFVARRKPCKDFGKYEPLFKEVQKDLASGKRKLIEFQMDTLAAGNYYVHNGILFFLESVNFTRKEHYRKDGTRVREDGRTRCIFENGTVSNMLFRSVSKALYANGKAVTQNIDKIKENFIKNISNITDEDKEVGYIYVLKSKSKDERISSIQNLYKIGYSKTEVSERIKNAEKEPTYLMAPVKLEGVWKCFNMNPQKLEQLLHNFFGNSCLELDIFDKNGRRHTPREWFIVRFDIIEKVIKLIINRKIINYIFDAKNMTIINKQE